MKFFSLTLGLLLFVAMGSFAQSVDTIKVNVPDSTKIITSHWKKENIVGFDLNEIAFVNWSAGGNSSISGLLKGTFTRNYNNENLKWSNELIVRYGISKQDGVELRKTDDAFQINSTVGYRKDTTSNWFHSAKFNFNTQFTNGYAYPNTDLAISRLFAPAYTFLGVGAEYNNKAKYFQLYISPLTLKNTLVFDQRLANQGAFGVEKAIIDPVTQEIIREGKNSRTELGFLFTSNYKKEIFKNIKLDNRLNLYTDYLNHFGNIDIDWQMNWEFIVNKHVRATVNTHVIYDDDIKAKEEIDGVQVTVGPKLQLKQMLGIGLIYSF
ncbi:hypothetical protein J2X31_000773 [Flavobacterium arsenatis]|uniref:DUF3078 domain-containing protein n=1 Tax=Flavobacterium arsenatis TaxID=1484332 RepID=A0ABU1TLC6_9FLAO|nr:DUF3078 domain-containing protein [Flavobacterium arsenatis]MDR6966775.1 hypothetical protein [Flavobacterium arsenatis]